MKSMKLLIIFYRFMHILEWKDVGAANLAGVRSHLSLSWSIDVGDITSSSEKAEVWVVLLHPSTICNILCCVFSFACWRFHFQYGCWRNISFCYWSLSGILPITKDCWYNFSQVPSLWNCGIDTFKTEK